MSQVLEKKYRVDSFEGMLSKIKELGAKPTIEVFSTHYYAHLKNNDTLKMIDYGNKIEIHRLSTRSGLHSLDEVLPIESLEAGYKWFKKHGYHILDTLDMRDREYSYNDGGFALYTVDNQINSVILGYTESDLPVMESVLGLQDAERISEPYNKYMARLGLLRHIELY